jgi:GntR family transcriptional regulator
MTSGPKITIDEDDRRPIYVQIVDGIKSLIARGELVEGTALPPVRQLAADLGVNMNTIAGAYRELQDAGLVAVRHGSGAVVASNRAPTPKAELRRTLHGALAGMILAGLDHAEIAVLVDEELRKLLGKKA